MRIVAGILTLYVHLAYSIDLVDFFGPDAWCNQAEANKARAELPHVLLRRDWKPEEQTIGIPEDSKHRELLRKFMHNVLADPLSNHVVDFIGSLALLPGNDRDEVLRFLEKSNDDQALAKKLQDVIDGKTSPEELDLYPRLLSQQPTREAKERLAEEIRRFNKQLPTELDDRRQLMQLFLEANSEGWGVLRNFIVKLGEQPPDKRDDYIDYIATWNVPPERTYAMGWHTYSPWFHVTDERYL